MAVTCHIGSDINLSGARACVTKQQMNYYIASTKHLWSKPLQVNHLVSIHENNSPLHHKFSYPCPC